MRRNEHKFELLFGAELALFGAAWYLQHMYKITHEANYKDALRLVDESIGDIQFQRERLQAEVA